MKRRVRAARLAGALAAAGLLFAACRDEPPAAGPPAAAAPDWSQDDRFQALLVDCPQGSYFDRDTSDLLPILVGKLAHGQRDVLHAVRSDLAALGQAAVPELERLAAQHFAQRDGVHVIQNVLGVLWLSDAPGARAVLANYLAHPAETVRSQAIRGLCKHASPAEFDALLAVLPITPGAVRPTLVEALQSADPRRLEQTFAGWIEGGAERDLWSGAARLVLAKADARSAELLGPLEQRVSEPQVRTPLLGILARGGDGAALEELLAEFEDPDPQRRRLALETLELVGGHLDQVGRILRADVDPTLRVMAASLLGPQAAQPNVQGWLRVALDDASPEVRQTALAALLGVGDAQAADRVLALLGRARQEMQMALFAVRENWDANPGLAEAALAALDRRQQDEASLANRDRRYLIQAIGLVPGRASAELLLELGRRGEGDLDRMSLHRFHVLHVGNTGPQGLALLRERFVADQDPARRMDYLWGATGGADEPTRQFLIEVLLAEQSSPYEKLLAADRLVRLGPGLEIAPLLKRATLRVDHPQVRVALQCLLWQWYG